MKPLFSERARKILTFYSRDKQEWMQALFQEMSKDKLTQALGGDKEAPYEMEYFKRLGYFDCSKTEQ